MVQMPPPLSVASGSVGKISIIDTTARVSDLPISFAMQPPMAGFESFHCPSYAFLIESSTGRKILFDLGIRKDLQSRPPVIIDMTKTATIVVEKGVSEILGDGGVKLEEIEAIVWSHWHWDHLGDPSTFPSTTDLIVGPGFKENFVPGYPANPSAPLLESDYEGRSIMELDFSKSPLKVGRFNAIDHFGDGSFYLLDSPGHAIGHLCGLVRTSQGPDTFILLGADACHHGGAIRPSPYLPIPTEIMPHPFHPQLRNTQPRLPPCPGALFEALQESRGKSTTESFFAPVEGQGFWLDVKEGVKTQEKIQEVDALDNVFVVMAHDESLLEIVDFFPKPANEWKAKKWAEDAKWAFLLDFQIAVEGLTVEGGK